MSNTESQDTARDGIELATEIYQEHGEFLRAVIRCRVRDPHEADDLFQSFFLSLAANPPRKIDNLRSYLYRALTNDRIDRLRRQRTGQKALQHYADRTRDKGTAVEPADRLANREEVERMFELIENKLPEHEGRSLKLRYRGGLDNDQIAEEMGVSNASVRRYICVGLKKIRQCLGVNQL